MHITDPIADMLTRIRNANSARHDTVEMCIRDSFRPDPQAHDPRQQGPRLPHQQENLSRDARRR